MKLLGLIGALLALLVGVSLIKAQFPGPLDAVPDFWPVLRDPVMEAAGWGSEIARRVDYIVLCCALGLAAISIGQRRRTAG